MFSHVGKHRERQSINAKLFLPILPIGIVRTVLRFCETTFVETAVCDRAHCSCASLLHTQIHRPRHALSERPYLLTEIPRD